MMTFEGGEVAVAGPIGVSAEGTCEAEGELIPHVIPRAGVGGDDV